MFGVSAKIGDMLPFFWEVLETMKLKDDKQRPPKSFRAGDTVKPGAYVCTTCGYRLVVENEEHIPPCPQCYATKFTHG